MSHKQGIIREPIIPPERDAASDGPGITKGNAT